MVLPRPWLAPLALLVLVPVLAAAAAAIANSLPFIPGAPLS